MEKADTLKNISLFVNGVLLSSIFFGILWADSNGVWHNAEDVRPGIFGGDEDANAHNNYTFLNDVYFEGKLISGIYSINIDGLTTLNELHSNSLFSNNARIDGSISILDNTDISTLTGDNRFSLGYESTGVYDDATSNGPYSRINSDSFHTNGIGVGQIYIEGRAIDANSNIYIGSGKAGGQTAKSVYINDPRDASGNQLATKSYVDANSGSFSFRTYVKNYGASGSRFITACCNAGDVVTGAHVFGHGCHIGSISSDGRCASIHQEDWCGITCLSID